MTTQFDVNCQFSIVVDQCVSIKLKENKNKQA